MALRSTPAFTVPTTGPRARADAAPHWIGKRVATPARPGWEVSRMWPVRLLFVIDSCGFNRPKSNKPPARHLPNERPQLIDLNMGRKPLKIKTWRRQRAPAQACRFRPPGG